MKTYLYFVTYDLAIPDNDDEHRNYETLESILENSNRENRIILRGLDVAESCWFVKSNIASADDLKDLIKRRFTIYSDDEIDEDVDTLIVAEIKWGNIAPEGPAKGTKASADEILDWLGMLKP